jgi:hypothetical protein
VRYVRLTEGHLVTGIDRNILGNGNVIDIADNVFGGNILHRAVTRRAADVDASSITLVDIIDGKSVDTSVGVGSSNKSGKNREEGGEVDHVDDLMISTWIAEYE